MYIDLISRTISVANYIVENKSTIRETAKQFNISKSTLHHDLQTKLPYINKRLYDEVQKILDLNFQEKHLRGGESTKHKYLQRKVINSCLAKTCGQE